MAEVTVWTNRLKEVVYEYSTNSRPKELSMDPGVSVMLFYNGGNRTIVVSARGNAMTTNLKGPKKPDSTPLSKGKSKGPNKGDQKIKTDKAKEAIYEYSTGSRSKNLSMDPGSSCEFFYNRGNRKLVYSNGRFSIDVALKGPKKPDYTP